MLDRSDIMLITVSNFVHNYLSQYIKIILLSTLHFIYMLKHMTLCQKIYNRNSLNMFFTSQVAPYQYIHISFRVQGLLALNNISRP